VRVCECRRVSESARVRVRVRPCARVPVRARVCGSGNGDVCLRASLCDCGRLCVSVYADVSVMRAFVCACKCVVPFRRQASPRMCVRVHACVGVWNDCARMHRRCVGAVAARRRPAVLIARPAAARARLRFGATGFRCRARLPQVGPSPLAPSRRDGLRDLGTRRWSTPPAPSTSSAASATTTSTTCG
jgi:hypothetical protein